MSSVKLYSCCSCHVFRQQFGYFFAKTQPYPQRFSIAIPFSGDYYRKQAGYEELAGRFGQIRNV